MISSSASRRASVSKKYKAACDQCHNSKVKCPGGGPPCKRCTDTGHKCYYSLAARIGKPPGSKNRKTLERLHREKTNSLETSSQDLGSNGSVNQISDNENSIWDPVLATGSDHRNGDNPQSSFSIPDMQSEQPISSLIDCLGLLDTSQSSNPSPEGDLECDLSAHLDNSDEQIMEISDIGMPTSESTSKEDLQMQWADIADHSWSSWSTSIDQHLLGGSSNAGASPGADRNSSTFEMNKYISLDTRAGTSEERNLHSTLTPFGQSPDSQCIPCHCLRKYTDVLCQLQTIEKRRYPIQTDTLLTYTNLVLSITTQQSKCPSCLFDTRVLMQLIMIFQTIFTWAQSQCLIPNNSSHSPDLTITLGRHEMTNEETRFVKTALLGRALNKTTTASETIKARIEQAMICPRRKHSWEDENKGDELEDLQRRTESLIQRFNTLREKVWGI